MSVVDSPKGDTEGQAGPSGLIAKIGQSAFWQSIFKYPFPRTPAERAEIALRSFALHVRPAVISRKELKFTSTFRLGALSVALFGVLVVTGVLMMFYYVPATDHAYKDMVDMQDVVSLGRIVRNLHHWSAYGMIILVCLHMLRVFLSKAFRKPRQFNWVVGLGMLVVVLLLSFTGYLLPWDQLAYWGVTVGSSMAGAVPVVGEGIKHVLLGGGTVDQPALQRFYVLHVMVLPMALTMLVGYHFWRVRKDGHSSGDPTPESPDAGERNLDKVVSEAGDNSVIYGGQTLPADWEKDHVPAFPQLLAQEFLALGAVVMGLLTMALLFDAPLEGIADPGRTPNPVKAPWYFVSLQELLHYAPPFIAGVCVPSFLVFLMCLIPYNTGKKILFPLMLLVATLVVPFFDDIIWGGLHAVAPAFADTTRVYGLPSICLIVVAAFLLRKVARSARFDNEAVVERWRKGLFMVFVSELLVLVLIGQFFRGSEWKWVWPWH